MDPLLKTQPLNMQPCACTPGAAYTQSMDVRSRVILGIVAAVLLGSVSATAASASRSPSGLLLSVLAAAHHQRSVHYVSVADVGSTRLTIVGDAEVTDGAQQITFSQGGKTGIVIVIVSGHAAYLRGDRFALVNYLGFKPAPAAKYSGAWILIPSTNKLYPSVANDVTLGTSIDSLELVPPLSSVAATELNGQHVVGVRGTGPAPTGVAYTGTVYAEDTGTPLPVEEVEESGTSRATITFSRWNEPVRATAPTKATRVSTTGLE